MHATPVLLVVDEQGTVTDFAVGELVVAADGAELAAVPARVGGEVSHDHP